MTPPKPHPEQDPEFVYVIYIAASPRKVWDALADGEAVRAWWAGTQHDSTFEPGDPIVYRRNGKVDVRGEILEREAPHRLVYTFHVEGPGPQHDEGETVVEYKIEASGSSTRLTVTHSRFIRNSAVRKGVSNGWPAILSSLKSVLEGAAVPFHPDWEGKA
jgi:uncharacterized protein YndB with AHSA1/START domain